MLNTEFAKMYADYKRWFEAQQSWPNEEVRRRAERLLYALQACAMNNPVPKALIGGLADNAAAFEAIRSAKPSDENGHAA